MRRKKPEINIFSISTLDLFASALGVFMLLTVIFLPFFPNTGDAPGVSDVVMQRLAEAEAEAEAMQAQNDALSAAIAAAEAAATQQQSRIAALEQEIARLTASPDVSFPSVDIVVALDSTGSMRAQIDGLKAEVAQFAALMQSLSPSFAMGIVEFKDRCDPVPVRSFTLTEMTPAGIESIRRFSRQINAGASPCNLDGPEALRAALQQAVAMPWRTESQKRLIVVISDNPAYPEEMEQALALAGSFRGRGAGHAVAAVHVGDDPIARAFLSRLAAGGGGEFVESGGSFTATILLALAGI